MAQFQFNEDQQPINRSRSAGSATGLSGKLIALGIVKNQTQANVVLLLLMTVCVVVIIFNLMSLTETPTPATLVDTPTAN